MGTPRDLCERYTVGMAFPHIERGTPRLQLPGGQICIVVWKENFGGFTTQSSKEALKRRYYPSTTTSNIQIKGKTVSMIFLLCPICLTRRCRVLYRPNHDLWGCRHCQDILYERISKPSRRSQQYPHLKNKELWLKERQTHKNLCRQLAESQTRLSQAFNASHPA